MIFPNSGGSITLNAGNTITGSGNIAVALVDGGTFTNNGVLTGSNISIFAQPGPNGITLAGGNGTVSCGAFNGTLSITANKVTLTNALNWNVGPGTIVVTSPGGDGDLTICGSGTLTSSSTSLFQPVILFNTDSSHTIHWTPDSADSISLSVSGTVGFFTGELVLGGNINVGLGEILVVSPGGDLTISGSGTLASSRPQMSPSAQFIGNAIHWTPDTHDSISFSINGVAAFSTGDLALDGNIDVGPGALAVASPGGDLTISGTGILASSASSQSMFGMPPIVINTVGDHAIHWTPDTPDSISFSVGQNEPVTFGTADLILGVSGVKSGNINVGSGTFAVASPGSDLTISGSGTLASSSQSSSAISFNTDNSHSIYWNPDLADSISVNGNLHFEAGSLVLSGNVNASSGTIQVMTPVGPGGQIGDLTISGSGTLTSGNTTSSVGIFVQTSGNLTLEGTNNFIVTGTDSIVFSAGNTSLITFALGSHTGIQTLPTYGLILQPNSSIGDLTVINNGSVTVSGGGAFSIIEAAAVTNNGSIQSSGLQISGTRDLTIDNYGSMTVTAFGLTMNTAAGDYILTINNYSSGSIAAPSSVVSMYMGNNQPPFTPSGNLIINNSGSITGSDAVSAFAKNLTLNNNGSITASAVGGILGLGTQVADPSIPTGALEIQGVGSLSAGDHIFFTGSTVTVDQGSITGNIMGGAIGTAPGSSFSVTATTGNLNLLMPLSSAIGAIPFTVITTNNGDISIWAKSGDIIVNGTDVLPTPPPPPPGPPMPPLPPPSIIAGFNGDISFYNNTNSVLQPGQLTTYGNVILKANNIWLGLTSNYQRVYSYGPTIASTGGNVTLDATVNVNIGSNFVPGSSGSPTNIFALGGNVLVVGGTQVQILGTAFKSVAQLLLGNPAYAGGGIGIYGGTGMDPAALQLKLVQMQSQRVYPNKIDWDQTNPSCEGCTINVTNGGYLQITTNVGDPSGQIYEINFANNGGVVYIDPPIPGGVWLASGTSFTSVAPAPEPPSPTPPCTNCTPLPPPPQPPLNCTDCIPAVVLPPTRGGDPIALSVDKTPPREPAKPMPLPVIEDFQIEQYIVAGSPCTLYECPALGGSQVQGQVGTIFSARSDKTLVLIGGRMLAGAGESGLEIQLGSSKQHIKLKGKTIAIVDAQAKAGVRVTVLAGNGPDAASVGVGNESLVALGTGEEALLMDQGSTEQLIAADGVERQPIGGSVTKFGLTMHKASVAVEKLVRRETLLTCCFSVPGSTPHTVCRDSWVSKRLHQLYGENQGPEVSQTTAPVRNGYPLSTSSLLGGASARNTNSQMVSTQLEDNENNTTSGQLIPIAYVSGVVPTDLRVGQDTEVVNVGPGHYRLVRGTMLTAADKKLTIDTAHGVVVAKAGSAVLISTDNGLTQVLNLVDLAAGDVNVIADKRSYKLAPGSAVGIVQSASKTEAVTLVCKEKLARRRMQILDVNANTQLVTNDFSVLDALQRSALLANLRKSATTADKHLFANIGCFETKVRNVT